MVQAHRGACAAFMENSIPAFREALRVGVHGIELDVQLTADNHAVVFHDDELNPETTVDAKGKRLSKREAVLSKTLAEIQSYRVSLTRKLKPVRKLEAEETRVSSLSEVMQFVYEKKKSSFQWLDIEMKVPLLQKGESGFRKKFISAIQREMKPLALKLPVAIRSFDLDLLKEFRKLDRGMRLGILTEPGVELEKEDVNQIAPHFWAPCFKDLRASEVARVKSLGVLVIPWTINSVEDLKKCREMKCDGVTSDEPELLLSSIRTKV